MKKGLPLAGVTGRNSGEMNRLHEEGLGDPAIWPGVLDAYN